ncbi:MAG: hypothetical protein JSW71_06410 [Gemmatimonadota bacterium]|nr:MAG: hypothetical protein JSW71_06410 [Gemmatimonadota bacterium]
MTESQQPEQDRRKSDRRSQWKLLRQHVIVGGWLGNVLFLVVGIQFGFFLGGYGGAKFFEVLFLMDLTGPVAAIVGSLVGVVVGLLSVWGILVVVCAAAGAAWYWVVHRSFPTPT